jgi:hypothetical protein
MSRYCRAYLLAELRAFDGWTESPATGLADEDIVYLCDDLTVVRTPVLAEPQVVRDVVDSAWREFCTTRLSFDREQTRA